MGVWRESWRGVSAHRLEQMRYPRGAAVPPASMPRQILELAGAAGLLIALVLFFSWLGYHESPRFNALDVATNAGILIAWMLFLVLIHYRCTALLHHAADAAASMVTRHAGRLVVACCVAVAGIVLFTALVTLRAFPNSGDEYAFIFQAETLAAGRLWNEPPAPADAFNLNHVVNKAGKWVGKYPPGWPAVLAAFGALRLPAWSVNPIVGLASLLVFYLLCRRLGPPALAVAGVALLGGNAFFIFNSASYFNHALVMLGGLGFALCGLRLQDRPDWRYGLAAGLALGAVGVTRHLEAILFALPLLAGLAGARQWRGAVWIFVGGAPFLIALMIYYDHVTGSPLLPTMAWDDPNDTLGFLAAGPDSRRLVDALLISCVRILRWSEWTSQPVLPLYGLAFLIKICRRDLRFFDFYFPLFVVGHLFYTGFGGNQYGPRYFYPVLPFVLLTLLTGTQQGLDWLRSARQTALPQAAVASAFVLMLVYVPLWSARIHTVVYERLDLYRQVADQDLSNAMVLIADATSPTAPMPPDDLIRNGIGLDGAVLYALDLGVRNEGLRARYADREFWVYRRREGRVEGTLTRDTANTGS